MENILKYTGLGGLGLVILLCTFRAIIKKSIFPTLSQRQGYNLFRYIIFSAAFISILSLIVYFFLNLKEKNQKNDSFQPTTIHGDQNKVIQGNNNSIIENNLEEDSLEKQKKILNQTGH